MCIAGPLAYLRARYLYIYIDYYTQFYQMQCAVGNAKQFSEISLKCLSGTIPAAINGTYFRNGIGTMNYGNVVLDHWFSGDGCILKLAFSKGQCKAQMKFVQTPLHKRRQQTHTFGTGILKKFWDRWRQGKQYSNPANTSVLCLKNSPDLLALCQGGEPFILKKQDLKNEGFSNFGWMTSSFSAHPKVDPTNGDIYNIGMNYPNFNIMRATKEMKKICETTGKLREIQSIHDFCLAGDFLVIFEGPIRFNLKDLLWGNKFFFNCLSFDEQLPTLVHIYSKENLQHIKTIELEPFYSFHFTNGFSTNEEVVVEYVKYDLESSKQLFKLLQDVPKFSQADFSQKYRGVSTLQELTISLKDFKTKTKSVKINGEFPVCEDHEVGKKWKHTYIVGSQADDLFLFDTILKYDRDSQKLEKVKLEGKVHINEPALIRTPDHLYLMCVVNREKRTYVEIYDSESLKNLCQLELPEFVPAGFHGKWESTE